MQKSKSIFGYLWLLAIVGFILGGIPLAEAVGSEQGKGVPLSEEESQLLKSEDVDVPHKLIVAKDFEGVAIQHDQSRLYGYQGKLVILNFWATWCTPCLAELPDLEELHREGAEHGIVVLAVAMGESKERVEKFLKKHPTRLPIMVDPEMKISDLYGVRNIPITYIMAPDMAVIGRAMGPREWAKPELKSFFKDYALKYQRSKSTKHEKAE